MTKHAQGEHVQGITLNTVSIKPVPDMNAKDVKRIRTELGMSQGAFAAVIGVSKKTVEAWEAGTNVPGKPVVRLIHLILNKQELLKEIINY